jgi:hypothetical protein
MRATTASGTAVYVYGVLPAGADLPGDVVAVDGSGEVGLLEEGDVAAIVSSVPLAEFGQERLEENLNRLPWLEEKVRAHERVLEAALDAPALVPFRFCTLFSTEGAVRSMLVEQEERLGRGLERLAGRREWGVKAYVDEQALAAAVAAEVGAEPEPEGARGQAYFARKRRERALSEAAEDAMQSRAVDVHRRLGSVAVASALVPLRREGAPAGRMALNGAYLVPSEREGEFAATVAETERDLEPAGFRLELTGPWPPYNFVPA